MHILIFILILGAIALVIMAYRSGKSDGYAEGYKRGKEDGNSDGRQAVIREHAEAAERALKNAPVVPARPDRNSNRGNRAR